MATPCLQINILHISKIRKLCRPEQDNTHRSQLRREMNEHSFRIEMQQRMS